MNAIPFDTLQFANRLKAVGFSEEQAQALTELQRAATDNTLEQARHDYHMDEVATRRDIKEIELKIDPAKADMKRDIETVRKEIAETKADLTRWVIGAGFLQTALIIGVLWKIGRLV